MEMGFPEEMCKEALERYDFDENLALNFLIGGWAVEFNSQQADIVENYLWSISNIRKMKRGLL